MKQQMKTTKGCIQPVKTKQQWQLYQNLGTFAQALNQLPDATEVRKNKPRSVPIELLPMVF
jgi:hypothetical protein